MPPLLGESLPRTDLDLLDVVHTADRLFSRVFPRVLSPVHFERVLHEPKYPQVLLV